MTKAFLCEQCHLASFGSIAQLGEHLPYKQGVTGSSPVVPISGPLVQLVRTLACHARGRGFESLTGRFRKVKAWMRSIGFGFLL